MECNTRSLRLADPVSFHEPRSAMGVAIGTTACDPVELKVSEAGRRRAHNGVRFQASPFLVQRFKVIVVVTGVSLALTLSLWSTMWSSPQRKDRLPTGFSSFVPKKHMVTHYHPPAYFSIATLNLGGQGAAIQELALQAFARRSTPDLLVIQNLPSPYAFELIGEALPDHDCIQTQAFAADTQNKDQPWKRQGNIFFNKYMWHLVEHGSHQFGVKEEDGDSLRHLLWARFEMNVTSMSTNDSTGEITPKRIRESVLVSSVSLTPAGSRREINSAKNIRVRESDAIVDILRHIDEKRGKRKHDEGSGVPDSDRREPILLVGDMGDGYSAQRLLSPVGLFDPFSFLHLRLEATYPALHSSSPSFLLDVSPSTRDWMFSNDQLRPVSAQVMKPTSPNDVISAHYPVQAVYELLPCGIKCSVS